MYICVCVSVLRGRGREREREREVYFKELAHMIVETGKSKIRWWSGDPGQICILNPMAIVGRIPSPFRLEILFLKVFS